MKKRKKEETYDITFLGLLCGLLPLSEATELEEKIELFMRRRGFNAIILDGFKFDFGKVEKIK